MFFSNKPSVILYISRSGLSLFGQNKNGVIDFPADAVQNLEVIDERKLGEVVGQFASSYGVRKQRLLCLLDDGVVFQKLVPKTADPKQAFVDFESKVPFDPMDHAVISLQVKDQQIFLATNKKLYQTILRAIEQLNCKIIAVSPAAVFGVTKAQLTKEQVARVLSNTRSASYANFLHE